MVAVNSIRPAASVRRQQSSSKGNSEAFSGLESRNESNPIPSAQTQS